jgi:hypothetical protein
VRLLGLAAALGAAACGAGRPRGPMSEGERLYAAKCTSCHSYEPHDYRPEKWRSAVAEMEHEKKVTLSPEQRELILTFLAGPKTP